MRAVRRCPGLSRAGARWCSAGRPTLVVMHGMLGSSRNWGSVVSKLAPGYSVKAIDLRNHGRQEWADSMHYAEMAADVREWMEDEGLGKVSLLGHSMGGKVAMTLALETPELVSELVVVDIAPVTYPDTLTHASILDAMLELDVASCRTRREADERLKDALPNTSLRQFVLTNLVLEDGGARWGMNVQVVRDSLSKLRAFPEGHEPYTGRTLFVAGGESDYITSDHHDTIRELFPESRHAVVEGAGHWVHAQKPREFMDTVNAFLQ
eukprot:TRINITY_DN32055_c0_g1_i1.p1 TRINITY_DN32055_c0_g1~~TRINITY_DN32055_c0_g1_i1.p1  ORF type:complete len:285 (+),score=64.03 TRINITY_DN32055_c0_g1_i1:58-855(+)